jgi:uncharacterized repeat protein (TIGR04076 family)
VSFAEEVGENEMHLLVRVAEIKGRCPVYAVGDSFRLEDGYRLVSEIPLCMHSLAALLPHYNALRVSEPEQWGLAGKEDKTKAYVQCLDAASYTDGGTAILEISKVDEP